MKIGHALAGALLCACSPAVAYDETARGGLYDAPSAQPARVSARQSGRLGGGHAVRASWYGGGERLNRHTASGEVFRPGALTAAHRTLPLGTRLAVTWQGRTIVVRVNDRGPAAWTGRSLDLSRGAAAALGFLGRGEAVVAIRQL